MTETVPQGTIRILMLEDSALDAELIVAQLARGMAVPFTVHRVWTRDAFLAGLEGDRHDVILADHVLPGFDGDTALALASERAPSIPFIFVSGTLTEELAVQALTRGARDYVVKQRLQRLPDAIVRAIREGEARNTLRRAEQEIAQSHARLRDANQSLERQVQERTADLRHSESRLQAVFESSVQLQNLLDLDGRVLDANRASLEAILSAKDAVLGIRFGDSPWFADTAGAGVIIDEAVRSAAQGDGSRHELDLKLPTGQRAFEFSFRPLRDHRGAIIAVVSEAVETTARRQAEEALRQSQKIEAVGQLTGGIAHDFNNILTVIAGNIEHAKMIVQRSDAGDGRAGRPLDNALKAVMRAASLTQRLLAFARRQPLLNQPVDLNAQLLGMQELLQRSLGELVQLDIRPAAGVWCVELDPAQLEASVLNLAVNARDAMPNGGQLTIEVDNGHLEQDYALQHPDVPPGQYAMLRVRDTGQGMPAATMARVFEPFFTTKEVGRGTGLGLSMVHGFVKQSGGHVLLESGEGVGTTVSLLFPRSGLPLPLPDAAAPPLYPELDVRGETVLVAEDNDDVRAYTVEALRQLGYRVLEAHDGPSALRLLQRPDVSVGLLFSDIVMPGMSGWELARQSRQAKPGLRILFTSGYPRDHAANDRTGRPIAILAKPFTRSDLARAVRASLEEDAPAA